MKSGTTEHPKFRMLKTRLNLPDFHIVGILESLWNVTGKWKDHGGIGEWTNAMIASAIGWDKDPDELIGALTETHWLDPDATYRLVVHDWRDHCPTYVHDRLRNREKGGYSPRARATSGNFPELPKTSYTSSLTQPNPTQPNPVNTAPPPSADPGAAPALPVEKKRDPSKPRAADPVWDTVVELWFEGQTAKPHLKKIGALVRDLKALNATADEIRARRDRYQKHWPRVSCTAEALVKHWHTFGATAAHKNSNAVGCEDPPELSPEARAAILTEDPDDLTLDKIREKHALAR